MSKEWNVLGSDSLENPKEKARLKWQKRHKLFKQTMELKRMKTEKGKKHYKEDSDEE